MRTLVILAAALAASVAVPGVSRAGSDRELISTAPVSTGSAAAPSVPSLRPEGRGLGLRQPLTRRSALAVSVSSESRSELPEVSVILGLQYSF